MKIIWRKIWPELAEYKGRLFVILFLGALTSALKAVTPELMRQLTDVAWPQRDLDLAVKIPIAIAIIWIVSSIGRYFHLYWMKYIAEVIALKFRRNLMNKYLSLNLAFFQNFVRGSGGLISRMLNDITVIQQGIQRVADIIREPFLAIFTFSYLLYIDWKLTVIILAVAPLITGVLRNLARSLRKYGRRNQESMEDLTKTLKESLDGARVVQSFNLENEMRDRFDSQAKNFLETRKNIVSREELAGPVTESLASITLAGLLIYIGNQVFAGAMSVGDFMAFLFAITLLQDAIKKMQSGYIKLQQAGVALDRLESVMETINPVTSPATPTPFPDNWKTINFKNVRFSFGKEPVLKGINLEVKRGEIVAIVGSSGGGKSTLVNLLERFFDPTEGEITIGDVPLRDMDIKELRRHIALVTQDVFLFSESIARNIQMGDLEKTHGIAEAAKLANAHDFISRTEQEYDSRVGDHGSRLSGGEKQRISIARAVFKNAPILILDEATSALDSESELEVQKGLDELLKGRTAFVIAHRLSTIQKADRILVLKDGQIAEQGSHDELMACEGEYFKFRQLQSGL